MSENIQLTNVNVVVFSTTYTKYYYFCNRGMLAHAYKAIRL